VPTKLSPERLEKIQLKVGAHDNRRQGVCAMEAVAWLAGRPHTDAPPCASPVLGGFLRSWNDALDDEGRQKLKPFLPRVLDTVDGKDEARAWLATDWLVRVCAPTWLELAGVKESPAALRALPPITKKTVGQAQPTINEARGRGAAAWDAARAAAWDAARAAAWDAARDAAWDAATDAARAAAWDAARDAAWDAARAAAWDAARDAAWAAAWAAARDAAWAAAWDAARDAAWDAAWAAADAALEPTKIELQKSALELLDRMIDP
jgi:hypothetical protein